MSSDKVAIRIRGISHQFGEEGDARYVRALRDTSLAGELYKQAERFISNVIFGEVQEYVRAFDSKASATVCILCEELSQVDVFNLFVVRL